MRKPTIYEALAIKLGREPSNGELAADCRRIIAQAYCEVASQGQLPRQRKR